MQSKWQKGKGMQSKGQMPAVKRAKGQMHAVKSQGQNDVLCRTARLEKASKEFNGLAQRSEQQATAFEHKASTALPAGLLLLL